MSDEALALAASGLLRFHADRLMDLVRENRKLIELSHKQSHVIERKEQEIYFLRKQWLMLFPDTAIPPLIERKRDE